MENIKWVFKCIKKHVYLINTLDSWQLCACAVNDHQEQSFYFQYVSERCFVEAFFFSQPKIIFPVVHNDGKSKLSESNAVLQVSFHPRVICNLPSYGEEFVWT